MVADDKSQILEKKEQISKLEVGLQKLIVRWLSVSGRDGVQIESLCHVTEGNDENENMEQEVGTDLLNFGHDSSSGMPEEI